MHTVLGIFVFIGLKTMPNINKDQDLSNIYYLHCFYVWGLWKSMGLKQTLVT